MMCRQFQTYLVGLRPDCQFEGKPIANMTKSSRELQID